MLTMLTISGSTHEFSAIVAPDTYFANVWHSDKGEWTIELVDGPVYRVGSKDIAIARLKALTGCDEVFDVT